MARKRSRSRPRRRAGTTASAPERVSTVEVVEAEPEPRGDGEPEPWSRRGLLVLMLIVGLLQVPLAVGTYLSDRGNPFAFYLVAAPANFLVFLISCMLAMPFARRIAGEPRAMRWLETLAFGALVLVLVNGLGTVALQAAGAPRTAKGGLDTHSVGLILALAVSDVVSFVLGAWYFPTLYRRLWMPRRRRR